MLLNETMEVVLGSAVILIMGLSFLARRHPHVRWLRAFNVHAHLTEEQRSRLRRVQNRTTGAELILIGFILPMGYLVLKVMLFSEIRTVEVVLVGLSSAACISLGVVALVRNR